MKVTRVHWSDLGRLRLFQSDKALPVQLKSTWAAHCAKCHCASSGSNPGKRSHHTGRSGNNIFLWKSRWCELLTRFCPNTLEIWWASTGSPSISTFQPLECKYRAEVVCRSDITALTGSTGVQTMPAGAKYILVHLVHHHFRLVHSTLCAFLYRTQNSMYRTCQD